METQSNKSTQSPQQQGEPAPLKLFIEEGKATKTGQKERIYFADGTLIAECQKSVIHKACRELVKQGYHGAAEIWSRNKKQAYPRMTIKDIERSARFTICENANHGPKLVAYKSRPAHLCRQKPDKKSKDESPASQAL